MEEQAVKLRILFILVLLAGSVAMLLLPFGSFGQEPSVGPGTDPSAAPEADMTKSLTAMYQQVANSPACLFIIVGVNIIIFLWEAVPALPSRYILHVSVGLGTLLYPFLAPRGSVPYDVPHPIVVLIINGALSGFIAFLAHKLIVIGLRKTFGWPPVAPAGVSIEETAGHPKPNEPQP